MTKATQKRKHSIRACLDSEGGARQRAGSKQAWHWSNSWELTCWDSYKGEGEEGEGKKKGEREGQVGGGGPENGMGFETSKYTPSGLHPTRSHLLILKKQFYQLGPNIQTYKLTESVLILTTSTKGELQDHPSTL